jgi:hypothetical protein
LVEVLRTAIRAPAMAAPLASAIRPVTDPVLVCVNAAAVNRRASGTKRENMGIIIMSGIKCKQAHDPF